MKRPNTSQIFDTQRHGSFGSIFHSEAWKVAEICLSTVSVHIFAWESFIHFFLHKGPLIFAKVLSGRFPNRICNVKLVGP